MQRYKIIPDNFTNFDLKSFIDAYLGEDVTKLTLRFSGKFGFDFALLAEQLLLYPKAQNKLPVFAKAGCFFTSKSFEQSSSEALALYKASLFKGNNCLDLSGGLGVDDWAFSRSFKQVVSLDKDEELNKLVRKNMEKLDVHNVDRITADAHAYIREENRFDLVYLDADRRPGADYKRFAGIEDTEPDVLSIKERLFELSDTILLKLSPMLDLSAVISSLQDVRDIYVVSLQNEVKELLVVMGKEVTDPRVHAVDVTDAGAMIFSGKWNEDAGISYGDQGAFFYEPALSLIKSGLSKQYVAAQQLQMLAPGTFYAVSEKLVKDFFGRSFQVIASMPFSKSAVKRYLKEQGIVKANVAKRNFPADVDELKKLFRIRDGGAEYLFFMQNSSKEKLLFHCRKV